MTTTEAIKERPLLMRGELVRATLEGRKNQTRRIMKVPPMLGPNKEWWHWPRLGGFTAWRDGETPTASTGRNYAMFDACPYGRVGDRIWVRESFWQYGSYVQTQSTIGRPSWRFQPSCAPVLFNSPRRTPLDRSHLGYHKRPSLFMERWMSRLTLEIADVRAQQIQDISEADALAEGIDSGPTDHPDGQWYGAGCTTAIAAFRELWDRINAKRGYSWVSNPWVWAISFRVID